MAAPDLNWLLAPQVAANYAGRGRRRMSAASFLPVPPTVAGDDAVVDCIAELGIALAQLVTPADEELTLARVQLCCLAVRAAFLCGAEAASVKGAG